MELIGHLEEQIALARDPQHLRLQHRWVIQDDGTRERVEQRKRIRSWWRTDHTGKVYLTVRYGSKAIEFEKGKSVILLADEAACQAEITKFRANIEKGKGKMRACLEQHTADLSDGCKTSMAEHAAKAKEKEKSAQ